MNPTDPQKDQLIGAFDVYLSTFDKHPFGEARRKGKAYIYPGRIDFDIDSKAINANIIGFIHDAMTNKEERLSLDLTDLKPYRVPMTRMIALVQPGGGGIQFCTADLRNQKLALQKFTRAIEQATGQTVEKYNNPEQKVMIYIAAAVFGLGILVVLFLMVYNLIS